jgi:tetratricopeptide (TPR) repeat protein
MHILGAMRAQQDVPGWLIPSLYFDYLRTGDARPMQGVFYHNAMDIVALAALLNHMSHVLSDPLDAGIEHGLDLIDLARLFEDLGDWEQAVQLYQCGLGRDLPADIREQTVQHLAALQRRRGCMVEAVELWRQAAEGGHIYAHVEIAKYYEHKAHDYALAARWTQTAIELVVTSKLPPYGRRRWLAELTHRLNRLRRKLGQ